MNKLIDFWYSKMEGKYLARMGHFTTDFMLTTIVGSLFSPLWGLWFGVIIGILKEVIDKQSGKGKPETQAAIVSILGAVLAYLVMDGRLIEWMYLLINLL